jgi:S-DNA-T family DNA segregation ATPase FtsK/SpoIIIE
VWPSPAPPYSFPLIATLAPVVVSLALWAVTQSVFALIFAALAPAVAVASLVDARIQGRRRRRRDAAAFAAEVEAFAAEIREAHDRERRRHEAAAPAAARLIDGGVPNAELWRATPADPVRVRLGLGRVTSEVEIDGAARHRAVPGNDDEARLRRLIDEASILGEAPVVVDARHGVGIFGSTVAARSAARGVITQVAAALSPQTHTVVVSTSTLEPPGGWDFIRALPHAAPEPPGSVPFPASDATIVRFLTADRAPVVVIAVAPRHELLPPSVRVAVRVAAASGELVRHPDGLGGGGVRPEHLSAEQVRAWAAGIAAFARREGLVRGDTELPALVRSFELPGFADRGRAGALDCVVAATAGEPLRLDLVEQGPHAVVGGTTGSGKSELLTAWILAMASAHSQRELAVLLVDFKGGSAFEPLQALPHCVGMITDLEPVAAQRALESLAAELRRRERHLLDAGAKSITALAGDRRMPRLVIVVDEFAAMVAGFPDLHALFSDIASRGRSLGVHLVLCTQRPLGAIRDAVLANSALRISLRVNNRADSLAVIGTDEASGLAPAPRGRAFVSADGGATVLAQFPLVTADDIARVAEAWSGDEYRPHRPWLEPLPAVIEPADLARYSDDAPGEGLPFGVTDDPGAQRQRLVRYDPREHGNLLVVGGARSGKSTLLATLGAAGGERMLALPSTVDGAWDCLESLLREIREPRSRASATGERAGAPSRVVLIDDLDSLVARCPEEYEAAMLDMLCSIARDGPAAGVHCVIATQRLGAGLHGVAALCGQRLLLGMNSRHEHVVAGGDPAVHHGGSGPGSGSWQGLRVQVAITQVRAGRGHRALRSTQLAATRRPLAVVTSRPRRFAELLRRYDARFEAPGAISGVTAGAAAAHPPQPVDQLSVAPRVGAILGEPDEWQAQWGALSALRSTHTIVVDGCSVAEFRAVTRIRALPPPLDAHGAEFWVVAPDGRVGRGRLEHAGGPARQAPSRR